MRQAHRRAFRPALRSSLPTEVRGALTAGAHVVKVFPASSAGGPAHIRALRSVLPDVDFCPTGGIEPADVKAYLSAGAAFVGMGGALVGDDQSAVQRAARQVVEQAG
jgi:2-dehydro-3-deoxyphosphogluconate aldolase / (4S)-4-hydroxy-2-oxoglutarate aldolase